MTVMASMVSLMSRLLIAAELAVEHATAVLCRGGVDDVQALAAAMASVMKLVLRMMPRSWRLQRCQCRCVVAAELATVMILVTVSSPSQSCRG